MLQKDKIILPLELPSNKYVRYLSLTEIFSQKEIYCPAGEVLSVSKASVSLFSDTDTDKAVCEEDATPFAKQMFNGQNKITASVDLFKHVHCHVQKGLMVDYSCQPE